MKEVNFYKNPHEGLICEFVCLFVVFLLLLTKISLLLLFFLQTTLYVT